MSKFAASTFMMTAIIAVFFAGREVELARSPSASRTMVSSKLQASPTPQRVGYQQLPIDKMLWLPFPQFYEALRQAPTEARNEWMSQLAQMPESPRRTAAISAFYKLLVQFDSVGTANAVKSMSDEKMQSIAFKAAADKAPATGLKEVVEMLIALPEKVTEDYDCDYLSKMISQWSAVDPAAVTRFLEERHSENGNEDYIWPLRDWTAIDPEAA